MLTHHDVRFHVFDALRRGAAIALLAGGAVFGGGQVPAIAQSMSWEEGCAMRVVTPGYGDAMRVYNCARQKECQQMANTKGSMMMGMGCFGVMPNAAPPAAQARQAPPVRKR